jgi:hypothetical protein
MAQFLETLKKIRCAFAALFLGCVATATEPVSIQDAVFEPGFERVLSSDATLLHDGGAKLIEIGNTRYFVAVGFTSVLDSSPTERVRQLRVARVQALKQAVEFANPTRVTSEVKLSETTTVTRSAGVTSAVVTKSLDETTIAQIHAMLKAPPHIGSWKSSDGQMFFYAIGAKLK